VPEPPTTVQLPEARTFLVERFGTDIGDVEYVGEGAWSRCFGFSHEGAELVVRFGLHVEDFERDRLAARFASAHLPIPQVIEIDEALDAWYCISTRARGTPLEQLDATEWDVTLPSLLMTLDALRNVDVTTTSGYGGWNNEGNASHGSWPEFLAAVSRDRPESRTHGWRQRLIESHGDAAFVSGYEQMLEVARAFSGKRSIIHNDLLNRNVLAADGQITSVFDWGCSLYGDFVYELATIVFWSPWYPAIEQIDVVSRTLDHYGGMGLDVTNFRERLRCCLLHIGLEHIAYNAFLGDLAMLRRTEARMMQFCD
jgi:hygromycin-B 4-O-kinase